MSNIELTTKQRSKINRAIKALNDTRKEVQNENPDIEIHWYLEGKDNLNLVRGNTHEGINGDAQYDNVIDLFYLDNSSGGGW